LTRRAALARTLQRNEAAAMRAYLLADPFSRQRFGFSVARRAGFVCFASDRLPEPLFHRVLGFGVLAPATRAAIAAILRYYEELGAVARVEVAEGIAPPEAARLLEQAGFRRERARHIVHALVTDRPIEVRPVRGLRIDIAGRSDRATFGRLARAGFGETGERGDFVERSSGYVLHHATPGRFVGFIGRVDGEPAATGAVCLTRAAGGLYSDTTLPAYRGRGIQRAMIAARVALGLRGRRHVFAARTEGPNASARNYLSAGFSPLYRAAFYRRATA
jgi:GNAT superfamily N-acetyltransferase